MKMGPVPSPEEEVNDLLQNLKVDSQVKQSEYTELSPSQDGNISDSSGDASVSSGDFISISNAHEVNPESGVFYSTNGYATQAYAYDYTQGEWEEYPRYVGLNGVDPSLYPENGSVVYHAGYGYTSQPYAPYSPGPYQAVYADGQLYGHSAFHYPAPLYHSQYPVVEAADISKTDGSTGVNGKSFQRPGYPVTLVTPHGHYPRGVMSVHSSRQDGRGGFEGLRASAPAWVDLRSSEHRRPSHANKSQNHHQQSQPQKTASPPAHPGALGTAFPPLTRAVLNSTKSSRSDLNGSVDVRADSDGAAKPKGRGNGSGNVDILSEQNRGPRTSKGRSQRTFPGILKQQKGLGGEVTETLLDLAAVSRDQYNKPDFATSYNYAKFYIIKSYSEDDVHKSIKYSVWASTPNGNKRLDAAYQEAQGKPGGCPVFLFFSVNASGQFCGVAEMTGPVDFVKSMDFWQQDKWSGRFSVKWHIIKDIPNSHFRHIILENNDNKPVTNSRDTQEVQFNQGVEMLKIFKSYPSNTSILDDFQYYENRQKAMQEKRSRQLQKQQDAAVHLADAKNIDSNDSTTDNAIPTGKNNDTTAGVARKSYLKSLAGDKASASLVDVKAG